MNILLICPRAGELVGKHPSFLPLGVAYLAAVLIQDGHRVEVLDRSVTCDDEAAFITIIRRGYHKNPEGSPGHWDVVGFTVVTPTARQVYHLAQVVKAHSQALTVAGGPHVTALPEEPLQHGVDVVVHGEGELTLRELCQHRDDFRQVQIAGLFYLAEDAQVCHPPERTFIADLDTLPFPARQLFQPLDAYKGQPILGARAPIGNLMTSRGCPYNCQFCYKAVFGRKYRTRSVENILAEWRELIERYHVREIAISDDLFNAHPERAAAICERVIAERLIIPWSCPNGVRVDTASVELLRLMKAAGCYRVAFGVESGSQTILDRLSKQVTLAQIETAFKNARQCGLQTTAFLMLGNPGETEATMQATIDLTKRLGPDFAQFTIATPYPGTALHDLACQQGRLLVNDWDDYDKYEETVFFEMEGMSRELVLRMQRRAYREFYLQPRYLLRKLFSPATYQYFGRSVQGFLKFVLRI